MSSWRVAQHYGFGAARIPIHPEPHNASRLTLAEGFADLRREFAEGGRPAMLRGILGESPAIALTLLLMVGFFVTLLRDHSDQSPIEVVLFETAALPMLPEVIPEPEPIAVVPPPAPPKAVAPPPPPVELLAERPKPPPPPVPKPRPKPKAPEMPKLAQIDRTPPPPPAIRPDRAPRAEPLATAKPRVVLDAVAPPRVEPMHRNGPQRVERLANVPRPSPSVAPRLAVPTAPDLAAPSEAPPARGFRVAAAPNASRTRVPNVMPGLASLPQTPAAPDPTPQRRSRTKGPEPHERQVRVSPSLAAAPPPVPDAGRAPAIVHRREDRSAPAQRTHPATRPRVGLASVTSTTTAATSASSARRVAREAWTPEAPQGSNERRPGLAGVPLADLAVCVTDREEDRLKQAVLAAVTTQKECVSRAGTYRFVETKNLNSFLMWIDRASGSAIGDRCDELRNALDCLGSASQRAAR